VSLASGPARPFAFGIHVPGASDRASWLALGPRAEALGYTTVSISDHLRDQFAPFAALGALAAVTKHIGLSMRVLANDFRHPVILAKEAATLDVISNGRLVLGLGAGWNRAEFEAAGIPFDSAATRIERLGEAVTIIRSLLRGECVSFSGRHYRIEGLTGFPRPVQQPSPPILLGGGGRKMLTLASRSADIVSVMTANSNRSAGDGGLGRDATLERARVKVAWMAEAAGERLASITLNVHVPVVAVTDHAMAVAERDAPAHDLTPSEFLESPHVFIGTIPELGHKIESLRAELGFSSFTVNQQAMEDLAPLLERLAGR
jgi:probable F420-dependent oxidoreductase